MKRPETDLCNADGRSQPLSEQGSSANRVAKKCSISSGGFTWMNELGSTRGGGGVCRVVGVKASG